MNYKLMLVPVAVFALASCGAPASENEGPTPVYDYTPPPTPGVVNTKAPADTTEVELSRSTVEITCFEGDKLFTVVARDGVAIYVSEKNEDCAR